MYFFCWTKTPRQLRSSDKLLGGLSSFSGAICFSAKRRVPPPSTIRLVELFEVLDTYELFERGAAVTLWLVGGDCACGAADNKGDVGTISLRNMVYPVEHASMICDKIFQLALTDLKAVIIFIVICISITIITVFRSKIT